MHLAHWDEVEGYRREAGHIAGTWFDLGTAAGSVGAGVKRIQVDPGKWSTPAHVEGAEEELFYVLGGSGLSWQDGDAYRVGAGDFLVHLPEGRTHTLHAGPDGLDVLAFGQRLPHGNTVLPRARVAWMSPAFVDVVPIGDDHPFKREAAAGEPEVGELLRAPALDRERRRRQGGRARARRVALPRARPRARRRLGRHRALARDDPRRQDGLAAALPLRRGGDLRRPRGRGHRSSWTTRSTPLRPGHVVARPPATGVSHSFRAGESALTYLAYGTREPNDIAYYPRSNKVSFRGVGVMGRIEKLDYWEGEP